MRKRKVKNDSGRSKVFKVEAELYVYVYTHLYIPTYIYKWINVERKRETKWKNERENMKELLDENANFGKQHFSNVMTSVIFHFLYGSKEDSLMVELTFQSIFKKFHHKYT